MPKLPRYDAKVGAVAQGQSRVVEKPEFLTAGIRNDYGRIIAGAGQEMAELTQRYEAQKSRARRVVEGARLDTMMMVDKERLLDSLAVRGDYTNFENEAKSFISENMQKYRGMVTNDRDWELFQPKVEQGMAELAIRAKNMADKKMFQSWNTSWKTETTPTYMKEYINTGDPKVLDEYEKVTRSLMSVGAVHTDEGAAAIKKFRTEGDTKRAIAYIDKNGLAAWDKLSTQDKVDMFPNIENENWSKIRSVTNELRRIQKDEAKAIKEGNERTATLIATGDTFTLETGVTVKLSPDQKERMLRAMVEDGTLSDEMYRALRPYYMERGGKVKSGGEERKPNMKNIYRTNQDGTTEYLTVDKNDPDVVGPLISEGWSWTPKTTKKTAADRFVEAMNSTNTGKKAPAANPKQADPLGIR